ncbi:MAG: hypothetical protein LBV75_01505 [Paludibacter sp.]|jgi:uncharacterized protein involved in exopolysaccharide biosynthesis|nr:hypothetical protein [Paludibacter sp.]
MTIIEGSQRQDFSKVVDDELEIVNSKTLISRAIEETGISTEYYVKKNFNYIDVYPNNPFNIVLPKSFIDTLSRKVEIILKPKGNAYSALLRYDKSKEKYIINEWGQGINTMLGEIIINKTGNFDAKKQRSYKITITPLDAQSADLQKEIHAVAASRRTNAVTISTSSTNTSKAKQLLNSLVELYNNDAENDKNDIADNSRLFLEERIALVANEVDSIEKELENFRIANKVNNVDMETDNFLKRQSTYDRLVSNTQIQIGQTQNIIEAVKDDKNKYKPIPLVQLNAMSDKEYSETNENSINVLIKDYNALLIDYHTANADHRSTLEQQISLQRNNVLTSLESLKQGLEISLNDLNNKILEINKKLAYLPAQERNYLEIKRQQEAKSKLYIYLLQKYEESSLAVASSLPQAKTLDKAYASQTPVSPNRPIALALALILGLCIPVAVLYIIDLLNDSK